MARHIFQSKFSDGQGRIIPSATISIYLAGTGTTSAANVYTAETGGSPVNSVTTAADGSFSFWVDDGSYSLNQRFKIIMTKTDFATKTYNNLTIFAPVPTGVFYPDANATDQGAATTGGYSLKDIIDAAGSNNITIKFRNSSGSATTSYTLITSEVIPATCAIEIEIGARITQGGTATLTINGPVVGNPMHQWLSGFSVGEVIFNFVDRIYVEWFGLSTSASAATNTTAIEVAVASIASGGLVYVSQGTFSINSTLIQSSVANENVAREWGLIGAGIERTIFDFGANTGIALKLRPNANTKNVKFPCIGNFSITGTNSAAIGLQIGDHTGAAGLGMIVNGKIFNIYGKGSMYTPFWFCGMVASEVKNLLSVGHNFGFWITSGNVTSTKFDTIHAYSNTGNGIQINGGTALEFVNTISESNTDYNLEIREVAAGTWDGYSIPAATPQEINFEGGYIPGADASAQSYSVRVYSELAGSYTGPFNINFNGSKLPGDTTVASFHVEHGKAVNFNKCTLGGTPASVLSATSTNCKVEKTAATPVVTDNGVDNTVIPHVIPSFLVHPASIQTNIATGGVTVVWGTERFDRGSNFASNTFTAPITGKYHFDICLRLEAIDTAATLYQLQLVTSNKTYETTIDPSKFSADVVYLPLQLSLIADMDKDDTAYVSLLQTAGAAQTDIDVDSYFSGYLIN